MAVFPCDFDRQRYRQAQQSVYWTEIGDHVVTTYKVRLCPQHFELVDLAVQNEFTAVEEAGEVPQKCERCEEPRRFTVSVRIYPAHGVDKTYVLDACPTCLSRLGNDLRIYNAEPLRDR